ncbi:hypothetical protein MMC27_004627 [Xylographa pallens]|nr:hypothetical protein [Xylographa pallens]
MKIDFSRKTNAGRKAYFDAAARKLSKAPMEMIEIYQSPTDALGVPRHVSLLYQRRAEQHARQHGYQATLPTFHRSRSSDNDKSSFRWSMTKYDIALLPRLPPEVMGIALFFEADMLLFSSEYASNQEAAEHVATTNSIRDDFSRNKLFGEKGILSRPPMDEATTRATVLGQGKVLVGATALRERKRDTAKRVINRAKAKMKKFKDSRSVDHENFPEWTAAISLDTMTQARLYAELELMVTTAINAYLMIESKESRMDQKSVAKILERWIKSGRSKPKEFMYDLETQLVIVKANLSTLRFHGPAQGDYLRIDAMLASWMALAMKLSRRTLCNPDTEIRKYFIDILDILELLGAPEHTFVKLQQLQAAAEDEMTE